MKRIYCILCVRFVFLIGLLAVLSACSSGLDPAWKADKTIVSLQLGNIPGVFSGDAATSGSSRALVQGGGYLYIQTGLTAVDAKIYGPFTVLPAVTFETAEIPSGSYPFMALIYVKNPDTSASTAPIIPAGQTSDYLFAALQTLWSDDTDTLGSSSAVLLNDITIKPNQLNTITATLVPVTSNTVIMSSNLGSTTLTGTPNTLTKRFLKLTNVSTGFTGSGYTTMRCAIGSSTGGTIYAVGLYNEDGSLVKYFSDTQILPSVSVINYDVSWNGGDSYYLYFEFTSAYYINLNFSGLP